ncbi:hypothetical protein [Ekhidna sp.]
MEGISITIIDKQATESAERKKRETLLKKFCDIYGVEFERSEPVGITGNSIPNWPFDPDRMVTINYYHIQLNGKFTRILDQYNALVSFCSIRNFEAT